MDSLINSAGFCLTVGALLLWLAVMLAPWRPWSTREQLTATPSPPDSDLHDVTVIIPARNEASHIAETLRALARQGHGLQVIVIDDQSTDATEFEARAVTALTPMCLRGEPLPTGWTGKLWALEQARRLARTPLTLALDADIVLAPDIIATARDKLSRERLDMLSLVAAPRMQSALEKLAMPAFVYFFKLLYPFGLSNSRHSRIAAAAGGFVLVRTSMLDEIDAFASLKGELIDDCALAMKVKRAGGNIWLGLSHAVISQRRNQQLADLCRMVSRTAFTQLRYSGVALCVCTVTMFIAFVSPLLAMSSAHAATRVVSIAALAMMMLSYLPTLLYYRRSPAWVLSLPLAALLYLAMTWGSAIGYWRGRRASWKGRVYRAETL
ncbi:MAG: glycosyltransferase [Gammaproteobacteria bacterium]